MEEHPIFTIDPATWTSYLHKEVLVTVTTGQKYTGRVYTIDPVSQSIALMRCGTGDSNVDVEIIMGHSVKGIDVIDDNVKDYETVMNALFKPKQESLSVSEMKEKQKKLKSWFLKNRLPVTETGENSEILSISDAVTIQPPYEEENCFSTNEIILGKIQGLIKTMPNDIDEW